jgi:hypothetical protein
MVTVINEVSFRRRLAVSRGILTSLLENFFSKADSISSTAKSAVRLCSSITGFTSNDFEAQHSPVVSNDLHREVRIAISCAQLYLLVTLAR